MIPQNIIEFFQEPGMGYILATRDEKLQPCINHAWGMRVNKTGTEMTIFVKNSHSEKHLGNLLNNGRIALCVGQQPSHRTYQFKGQYISHHPCNDEDNKLLDTCFEDFKFLLTAIYGEQVLPLVNNFPYKPATAITFSVEDIFNQTPGPKAGQKLV